MLTDKQIKAIEREKKIMAQRQYDTSYLNKKCAKCRERKPVKGGKTIRFASGSMVLVCADCSQKKEKK